MQVRHASLQRFIEGLARAPDEVMKEVDLATLKAAIKGARDAKADAPKAQSTLTNSIMNERVGLAHHRIVAEAGHAGAQEHGRAPGSMPPIEAIRRWLRVKNIRPTVARDERSAAFLIARKIKREGHQAQPYMEPQRETSQQRLQQLIPAAVERGIQRAMQ